MGEPERAMVAFNAALRHNPYSLPLLTHIANQLRGKEQFSKVNVSLLTLLGH
jgi:glucose repression mediator protein